MFNITVTRADASAHALVFPIMAHANLKSVIFSCFIDKNSEVLYCTCMCRFIFLAFILYLSSPVANVYPKFKGEAENIKHILNTYLGALKIKSDYCKQTLFLPAYLKFIDQAKKMESITAEGQKDLDLAKSVIKNELERISKIKVKKDSNCQGIEVENSSGKNVKRRTIKRYKNVTYEMKSVGFHPQNPLKLGQGVISSYPLQRKLHCVEHTPIVGSRSIYTGDDNKGNITTHFDYSIVNSAEELQKELSFSNGVAAHVKFGKNKVNAGLNIKIGRGKSFSKESIVIMLKYEVDFGYVSMEKYKLIDRYQELLEETSDNETDLRNQQLFIRICGNSYVVEARKKAMIIAMIKISRKTASESSSTGGGISAGVTRGFLKLFDVGITVKPHMSKVRKLINSVSNKEISYYSVGAGGFNPMSLLQEENLSFEKITKALYNSIANVSRANAADVEFNLMSMEEFGLKISDKFRSIDAPLTKLYQESLKVENILTRLNKILTTNKEKNFLTDEQLLLRKAHFDLYFRRSQDIWLDAKKIINDHNYKIPKLSRPLPEIKWSDDKIEISNSDVDLYPIEDSIIETIISPFLDSWKAEVWMRGEISNYRMFKEIIFLVNVNGKDIEFDDGLKTREGLVHSITPQNNKLTFNVKFKISSLNKGLSNINPFSNTRVSRSNQQDSLPTESTTIWATPVVYYAKIIYYDNTFEYIEIDRDVLPTCKLPSKTISFLSILEDCELNLL